MIQEKVSYIRKKIYLFVIVAGIINIFAPYIVSADLFGFEIQDVYANITVNVKETNDILKKAFQFSQTSPYTVVNRLSGSQAVIATNIRNASKTMALIVATILLMVDFFRKSINFEWSSKWENILIFLIKIIVMKQVVQNADVIVGYLYSMFQSINHVINADTEFLPYGTTTEYVAKVSQNVFEHLKKGWWDFWYDLGSWDVYNNYYYEISEEAVKMFYPYATFPATTNLNDTPFANPTRALNFMPTLEMILLQPYFLVMKALAYIIFVIAIGRVFELSVYTIFAPLPLATFASEVSHDVAKNFIKNYIATVLQMAVIAVMFLVYVALNNYVSTQFPNTKLIQFVVLISLSLGVVKSGAWSKKVCGL